MASQDSASTKVTRALSYLAEKYPGTAILEAVAGDPISLGLRLAGSNLDFVHNARNYLRDGGTIHADSYVEDVRIRLMSPIPTRFRSARNYVAALSSRYPEKTICVDEHIPVISKLIDQDMRFVICKGPRYHPKVDSGWGNGYVGVPEDHPWFEKYYDDVDPNIHGGLTYSGEECPAVHAEDFKLVLPDYLYWLGFDTGHFSDNLKRWPKEAVYKEAEYLYIQAAWAWAGIENPMHS